MSKLLQESEILEYLNASITVRGFFISAVNVFEQSIQVLIERVFLKHDFAVQSVVGPLLHDSGPLGDLSVRLKLLFGIGVIPHRIYRDIDDIIKLKNSLNNSSTDYSFTDPFIVNALSHLNQRKNIAPIETSTASVQGEDLVLYQMQVERKQLVMKSSLALLIISLCAALDKESPF